MIERMKDADEALRHTFMRQGFPYFSYRYGEKSRGITRIGKWEDVTKHYDEKRMKSVVDKVKHNVTPKKMLKVANRFTRYEREYMEFHLWLQPLSEAEQNEWRSVFSEINVIYDTK